MRVVRLVECVTPLATRLVMGALRAVRGPVPACHIHPFIPLLGRGRGHRNSFARYSPRAGVPSESFAAPSCALLLSAGFARLFGRRLDPVYGRRSPPAIEQVFT